MLIIWFILLTLSFLGIFSCIYIFLKQKKNYDNIDKEFIEYLERKNDMDTLYKIGEYNKYGHKEQRRAPGAIIALRAKFKETNDMEYEKYANIVSNMTCDFILLCIGFFICFAVFWSILTSFFKIRR